jgi:ELWxxDGT repeat protein
MTKYLALVFFAVTAHAQFGIALGNSGVQPHARYALLGDHAYFDATGDLWRTDATTTMRFADFEGDVHDPVALRGKIAFFVQSELWETDGHTTSLLLALDATAIQNVTTDGTTLWFTATQNGREYLWRSDGTSSGTIAVAQLPWPLLDLRIADGLLFYRTNGGELWRSDGTIGGTFALRQPIASYTVFETFRNIALVQHRAELWRSDGTIEGTYPLHAANTNAPIFAKTSEAAYFYEYRNLIRTDGTVEGTAILPIDADVHSLAVLDDRLYAIAYDGIWILAGTKLVKVLAAPASYPLPYSTVTAGNAIWFHGYRTGLWRFDGAALTLVHAFQDGSVSGVTALGEHTLYFAEAQRYGREPWITDGTPAGTHMLANTMPEGAVRGHVLDADGRPIERAWVTLYARRSPPSQIYGEYGWFTVMTDSDGDFAFEGLRDGTYYLSAAAHGFTTVWWRDRECAMCAPDTTTPIVVQNAAERSGHDFVLRAFGVIRGRVLDNEGKPIPSTTLLLDCSGEHYATSTDLLGFYQIPAPPDRDCVISTRHKNYANASLPVRVGIGGSQAAEFVLTPNGAIRGRLLDAVTGEALTIYAVVTARNAADDAEVRGATIEGGYTITLPDGRWEITIDPSDAGYAPATFPTLVSAIPGQITPGYDVTLTPAGARIGGRVLDAASGAGVGGVAVRVLRGDTVVASVFTNADGTYATRPDLAPGTYVVQLEASATRPGQSSQVSVNARDAARADFVVGRYPIVFGTVVDAVTREPLRNVRVGDTTTDAEGRYALPMARTGESVVVATKRGWEVSERKVQIDAADVRVDFALAPSCVLTPATTHVVVRDKITISLRGGPCTACASTTSPFLRFERACVSDELTIYAEGGGGTVALPGVVITVAPQ